MGISQVATNGRVSMISNALKQMARRVSDVIWITQWKISIVFDACNGHDYGFDPSAFIALEEEDYQEVVPDTSVPLSHQQMAFLENHCNPLQENDKGGENTYLYVV